MSALSQLVKLAGKLPKWKPSAEERELEERKRIKNARDLLARHARRKKNRKH